MEGYYRTHRNRKLWCSLLTLFIALIMCSVFRNIPVFAEESKARFKDISVTLGSEVGLNFYVEVPDKELSNTMTYTITGKGDVTGTTNLSNAEKQDDGTYKFTAYLNVLQMADEVTATFTYDGISISKQISVCDYLNALVDKYGQSKNTINKASVTLAKCMADYGYYAQQYLKDIRGFNLSNEPEQKPTEAYKAISRINSSAIDTTANRAENYALQNQDNLNFNYSLMLDSKTSIMLMIIPDGSTPKKIMYAWEGTRHMAEELDFWQEQDGNYYAIIEGISAHQLGEPIKVTIYYENDFKEITINALSYSNAVLKNGTKIEQKQCAAALLDYYKATTGYVEEYRKEDPFLFINNQDITLLANSYTVIRDIFVNLGVPTPQAEVISANPSNCVEVNIDENMYLNVKGISEGSAFVRVFTESNDEYIGDEKIIKVTVNVNPTQTYEFTCNVYDSNTNNAIENVSATFGGKTKKSGQDGKVIFEDVVPGTYKLEINYDGYETKKQMITIVGNQTENILLRKWITVGIAVSTGGNLYNLNNVISKSNNILSPYNILVPSGTIVSASNNPYYLEIRFTDPSDGREIFNFYSRETSDLYIFDEWLNVPTEPITQTPSKPIIANWMADINKLKPLAFNDDNGNVITYHPICDIYNFIPENYIFFGERYEGNKKIIYNIEKNDSFFHQYTMEDLKEARWYYNDSNIPSYEPSGFTAVRSINGVSYNDIYGDGGSGSKEVSEDWINSNLLKDESGNIVEKVETLYNGSSLTHNYRPETNYVKIEDIFGAYNSNSGFSSKGIFWSCVAESETKAYSYDSDFRNQNSWSTIDRDMKDKADVLISREFE